MKYLRLGFSLGGALLGGVAWLLMRWDRSAQEWFYLRPTGLLNVARLFSYLGWGLLMLPVAVLLLAVLWRPGWHWLAWRPVLALGAATIISETLKHFINRPHPDVIVWTDFTGAAFPSDHALSGLAFWMTAALVIGELWPEGRPLLLVMAGIWAFLIGWSQLYLGVHWPADIVAGWSAGLLLLAAAPPPRPPRAGRLKAVKT